ncbi:hypothetical protein BB561_005129 [Smittium simulii]|uniref:Chitin-binding type-2 domain-containing protein n=1 Tax=Smittium simulii TaxID=133385 RepID=A0A2T9YC24_9FUNG|nr:hypothetical protein BB561_005129 [Smittium simulii]
MLSTKQVLGFLVIVQALLQVSVLESQGAEDNNSSSAIVQTVDPGRSLRPTDDSRRGRRPSNDSERRRWPGRDFWRRRCSRRDSFCDIDSWRGYYECSRNRYIYKVCDRGSYCTSSRFGIRCRRF